MQLHHTLGEQLAGPPLVLLVLYELQFRHFKATMWNRTSDLEPQSLQRIQINLFWYASGIGVSATCWSRISQYLDKSQIDFEHTGHVNLKCCSISFKQSKCIVCPQRNTLISFIESNRYSKQTGQLWCMALSTH